jgi:integrase
LRDLLGEHLAMYGSPGGFVFTSAEGTPLRRTFYRRHYKPAVRRAGLPEDLRFHDLRHTCAALLIAQGAHPKEIQERLGHSTIRLTFDRYGHLLPSLDDRLREGLDRLWEEATHPVGALVSLPLSSEAP